MLTVDEAAFEAATKSNAIQSLRYAEGSDIGYDYQEIENWVYANAIHDAPTFTTMIPLFPFAGEGLEAARQ